MTSYLVYSTVALKWSRKFQCGNSCRRINLLLCFVRERRYPTSCFSNTPLSASNNFWTKVELSTKSDAFLLTNILLSLLAFFSIYCTVFLKLRYRDIVAFRTKNWIYETLVIDSQQTLRFEILSDHFTFQGKVPAWLLLVEIRVLLPRRFHVFIA